jgi:hypothetical protein
MADSTVDSPTAAFVAVNDGIDEDHPHELAILMALPASAKSAAAAAADESSPFAPPRKNHADTVTKALRGDGLLVDVVNIVVKGGVPKVREVALVGVCRTGCT